MPADLDDLPVADVVILGEVHDNPEHHLLQARALRGLQPAAVAFEMLDAGQAEIVNRVGADAPDLAERLDWADSGWPDFALYQPVFAAVGDARIYGLAVARDEVRRAVVEGAAAITGPRQAARFSLDRPLPDAEQAAREAHQDRAHCHKLPQTLLPGMVEAQRLRDTAFASGIVKALKDTGGPVAVIAGAGHARTDWGIPAALARAAPQVAVLSIGQMEAAPEDADPPFDQWLVTAPAKRPDPCAGFRSRDDG